MTHKLTSAFDVVATFVGHIGPANLIAAFIALNFLTFAMFGIDKARAENGQWRVQESTLLSLALIGGTVGAYAGRRLFRHKTRKQPFNSQLFTIVIVQVLTVGGVAGWRLAG